MLIDTHVHLDDARYDADRVEMLARARQGGVGILVTIGTALDDSAWAADFAAKEDGVYATVGVHPERLDDWKDEDLAAYEALASKPKVVAIGEVGLDYHSPGFDAAKQQGVFREMIRLAKRHKLPLVIHQRDAAEDTLRLLEEEGGGSEGGVFHCFAGDLNCARGAMKLGFDLAVGGILTYPSAGPLREVIAQVPLEPWCWKPTGPGWPPRRIAASATSRPSWCRRRKSWPS